MRSVLTFMLALAASAVMAQEQRGIPAKVTAANGKEFPVYLQGMDGETITFQLFRSDKTQAVPARLISKLEFVANFDAATVNELFNAGDYAGMIEKMASQLKPSIDEYWPYMAFQNNFQDSFTLLMKAYQQMGEVSRAMEVSKILLQNKDSEVNGPAQSIAILAALAEGNLELAEGMLGNVESVPGQMYLRAAIARARGQYKEAMLLITDIIAQYGNELAWMPQAELLSAYLYMDIAMTNSAINTARQVKNIYVHTSYGTDAERKQMEWAKAQEEAAAAVKALEDAEEAQRAAVRARAEERAKGYGFDAKVEEVDLGTNTVEQAEDGMEPAEGSPDEGNL